MPTLSTHRIIDLVCRLREAERSIDKVNGSAWPLLRSYYDRPKREGLRAAADALGVFVARPGDPIVDPPEPNAWVRRWDQVRGRYRRPHTVTVAEARYVAAAVAGFLHALEAAAGPPPTDRHVELRVALCHAQYYLERYVGQTAAFRSAQAVEYLYGPVGTGSVRVTRDEVLAAAGRRRSARSFGDLIL
ncbi:MAG: hypothetical protein JWO31_1303, partial [Phycisphaerales bacterium]|nr:hypothetical protein [Phycisphaerales bacterium]